MRNETRVGVVVGLLVVVVTSVYFYGSSREDEDVLVGLGRRGGVQPGSVLDNATVAGVPASPEAAKPAGETVRAAPPASPPMFASGGASRSPVAEPLISPPTPDTTMLADALRPRRAELPPLNPSPLPLRTGSSDILDEATRRNLDPTANESGADKPPAMLDLDSIGERIRRNETAAATPGINSTVSPNGNGLTDPTNRQPITAMDLGVNDLATANSLPGESREGWPKQHRVEYGETLYGISVQYYGRSSGTAAILKANPALKNPKSLREGQTLVIPPLDAQPAALAIAPPAMAPGRKAYVVRDGDSFYTIAKRVLNDGKRWEEIYEMNKALVKNSPKRLRPGMTIAVPSRK